LNPQSNQLPFLVNGGLAVASTVYDRTLLLHGSLRNEVLTLAQVERYGLDSFADADWVSIYGMPPREWYRRGIRLLGRTAVECTRDELANCIAVDVATLAARISSRPPVVIDPFAGSCNTLFWILRHLPGSDGMAFESDPLVFELTRRNLTSLGQRIELLYGDYVPLLELVRVPEDRSIVAFVAPPWGTALDEEQGLDLCRTSPPVTSVIDEIASHFPQRTIFFAVQVYEKVCASSLKELQRVLGTTEVRIYDFNEKGRNHGILLGLKGGSSGKGHASF
jgi:hypothetical protein